MRSFLAGAIVVFALSGIAHAQQQPSAKAKPKFRSNAIFVDVGGQGGLLSINFETFIANDLAIKLGLGGFPEIFSGDDIIPIGNLMLNYITSARTASSHLELGFGIITTLNGEGTGPVPSATLGYRYQEPAEGFLFRIAFTPFWTSDGLIPWAAIGMGGRF